MVGIDPLTGTPSPWSLHPDDTLGLVFWTKNPQNLIASNPQKEGFAIKVHVTVTGWYEAEGNAPDITAGAKLLSQAAKEFQPENVRWRFSPIPIVSDVVSRFEKVLAVAADSGLSRVYLSFLQENDLVRETRQLQERSTILADLAEKAEQKGVSVLLCNEDKSLAGKRSHPNLFSGVCAPPEDFLGSSPSEGCGCALMVDPFTINEACSLMCKYCYASDKALWGARVDTTKGSRLRQLAAKT